MTIPLTIGAQAIVLKQGAAKTWVAKAPTAEGDRWRLMRKAEFGRSKWEGYTAGVGDIVVTKAAPQYQAGDVVWHNGVKYIVLADRDDAGVEFAVPEGKVPRRGGYTVHVAAGNTLTVSKADLVLEAMD